MSRQVEWAKRAIKKISLVDQTTRTKILSAIDDLAEKNRGDTRRLEGNPGTYRLRVGGWRVIFSYLNDGTILIQRVGSRGDVYKG